MRSLNKVMLIGVVGKDPEIKSMYAGEHAKPFASFSLATNESYKNNEGVYITNTQWHLIKVTNPSLIKLVEAYVKKGTRLYVEGQLKIRNWDDKDGVKRTITEIIIGYYDSNIIICSAPKVIDIDNNSSDDKIMLPSMEEVEKTIAEGKDLKPTWNLEFEIPF